MSTADTSLLSRVREILVNPKNLNDVEENKFFKQFDEFTDAHAALLAFAQCSAALDQENEPGRSYTVEQKLEVLARYGYGGAYGDDPLRVAADFVIGLRCAALAGT